MLEKVNQEREIERNVEKGWEMKVRWSNPLGHIHT